MDQNNEDQPLSSEEMLRRARSGLGDSPPTPPSEDDMKSSYDDMKSSYEDLEEELDFGIEPRVTEETEPEPPPRPRYEPPTPEPAEPEVTDTGVGSWAPPRSDDDAGVGSWAPPPAEPDQGAWGGQLPTPGQPAKSRGNAGKIVLLMLIVAGIGLAVFSMVDRSKTVDEIAVGDCMNVPEGDEFSSIDPIDCNDPHEVEVFAIIDMSTVSSEYAIGTSYPGDDVYFAALDECSADPFESYVGIPYASLAESDTVLWVDAFTPTLEGWQEFDDREVQCVLIEFDLTTNEIVQNRGSYRGSGGTL